MDILGALNDKQQEAVRATEGYVRVIAGAGSGKTKLLVSRYAYLVRDYGIDSANILCVTFTNKAAGEMKKRIHALIGAESDTTLICTYHGFCARVLRENPEKLFLTKGFQILDPSQQKSILGDIYQKYELKLDHAGFESILKKITFVKSKTDYVPRMCSPKPCQILPQILTVNDRIIEEYMQRQKAIYALDFNDLMSFALYLLETNSEVREKWQDRLNYIQVDEFQDSSKREMRLVDLLSAKYGNLMIVGDPDQNIYEWRGADVKLLVDFDKQHEPTQTIFLNRNYRSTPQILQCANALINKNELRLKKDLFTLAAKGAEVFHYHSKSDEEEVTAIAENIKKICKEKNLTYSDFAVLYRSGFLSRIVEKKLVESGIPYEIYGGVKFYQRMEVLDVIAYLRLIEYGDDASFKRIVNTPRRRFGRTKMSSLEACKEGNISFISGEMNPSLYETLKNHLNESPYRASDVRSLVSLIEEMREKKGNMRITEIVSQVTARSGYEQYIRELGDEERLENLAEFKRIADEFEKSFGENLTLDAFLQQIALQAGEDGDKQRDAVKLMTIHSAKGLEFPVVFVIGFTEGIFPSSKTIEERKKAGLEEERRLCYVAITRAKEQLFLMDSEGFSQNGIKKLPSRFLGEIGEKNYTRIGVISEELDCESRRYVARTSSLAAEDDEKNVGDLVEHHVFGNGTILEKDDKRGSYVIKFDKLAQPRNISKTYFSPKTQRQELPEQQTISDIKDLNDSRVDTPRFSAIVASEKTKTEETGVLSKLPQKKDQEEKVATVDDEADKFERSESFAVSEMPIMNKEVLKKPESALRTQTNETIAKLKENADNLWKRDDVPHTGWRCEGITDLGEPVGICEMCGYQIIRYVHHMVHENYRPLGVGCVCAGKMEGDIAAAKKREREFKNKEQRRESFKKRRFKNSKNGNPYLRIDHHIVVLYCRKQDGTWKFSVDNHFGSEVFPTREAAMDGAFEALERLKQQE
ncbi:MAG: ATP-dependent DNA helicase PcrA [Ruminococcaceae bacterium]|nr:ATP-dependent DNA helicase PcrA [Oscillospiraceae bacterium]